MAYGAVIGHALLTDSIRAITLFRTVKEAGTPCGVPGLQKEVSSCMGVGRVGLYSVHSIA